MAVFCDGSGKVLDVDEKGKAVDPKWPDPHVLNRRENNWLNPRVPAVAEPPAVKKAAE